MTTIYKDPLAELFQQTNKYKELCLDLLDTTASMGETGIEFIDFYSEAMKNLDDFFANNFHISNDYVGRNTFEQKSFYDSEKNFLAGTNGMKPTLKRTKMSQTEYLEKLLLDFGHNNQDYSILEITNRTSLPLSNERIIIDLKNKTITVKEEDSIKREESSNNVKIEEEESLSQLQSKVKVEEPEESFTQVHPQLVHFTQKKQSSQSSVLGEMTFMKKDSNNLPNVFQPILQKEVEDKENRPSLANSNTKRVSQKSRFSGSATFSKKTVPVNQDSLRKSLFDKFQQASLSNSKKDGVELPSEDKAFNKDLEELLTGIENYHSSQQTLQKTLPTTSPFNTSFNNESTEYHTADQSIALSNKIHNLLYSKTLNDEELDDHEEQGDAFKTFEDTYSEDPFEQDSDDEQYNVSDYSSESEETMYYRFHEQFDEVPTQNNKMFQFYNNIHFNVNSNPNINSNLNNSNTFGMGFNPQYFNNQPMSNSIPGENSMGFNNSISQNTMFHDYMYYLKQQDQLQNVPREEQEKQKKAIKLNASPLKAVTKVKRLYCNNKRIPRWATDLQEVEKISKDQKKLFNPNQIFGHFNVENLDLVDIFQMTNKRLLKMSNRGSSANWRDEVQTPSNQKLRPIGGIDTPESENFNVKKAILFNHGF